MTVPGTTEQAPQPETVAQRLAVQAERIVASDILARSDPLRKLFDFLVSRSQHNEVPKEFEIAQAMGKNDSFDVTLDATIRVYIHRLRKKLDDFYAATPEGSDRLSIPRGSYRLVLHMESPREAVSPPPDRPSDLPAHGSAAASRISASWRPGTMVITMVLCCLALAGGYLWANMAQYPRALASTAMWHPFAVSPADSPLRSVIVLGTETLPGGHPHLASMGSTLALASIVPQIRAMDGRWSSRSAIVNAAYMSPDTLKDSNIVYIGTLAQMGVLSDIVFTHSGFTPPDAASVLTDRASGKSFGAAPLYIDHRKFTSYGYLACLNGPAGNRLVVIGGATDGAIVQMAEIASDPAQLDALAARGGASFEALYAVETLDAVNVAHRLELVRPMAGGNPHS